MGFYVRIAFGQRRSPLNALRHAFMSPECFINLSCHKKGINTKRQNNFDIMSRNLTKSERKRIMKKQARKRFKERVRQVKQSGLIPQQSHFKSCTKVTYPKEPENLSCKKASKNKLLNMSTG